MAFFVWGYTSLNIVLTSSHYKRRRKPVTYWESLLDVALIWTLTGFLPEVHLVTRPCCPMGSLMFTPTHLPAPLVTPPVINDLSDNPWFHYHHLFKGKKGNSVLFPQNKLADIVSDNLSFCLVIKGISAWLRFHMTDGPHRSVLIGNDTILLHCVPF